MLSPRELWHGHLALSTCSLTAMVCQAVCHGRRKQGYWLGSFYHQICGTVDFQSPEKCHKYHDRNPFISMRAAWAGLFSTKTPAMETISSVSAPAHIPPHPVCLLQVCHNGHPEALSKCIFLIKNDPDLSSMRDLPAFPTLRILRVCLPDGRAGHLHL